MFALMSRYVLMRYELKFVNILMIGPKSYWFFLPLKATYSIFNWESPLNYITRDFQHG